MSAPRLQCGQALVETLVAVPFLLAVWFAVLVVAKVHDLESHAVATTHYAAFLRAASDPTQSREAASVAAARVWAGSGQGLLSSDRWDDRRASTNRRVWWRIPASERPLINRAEQVRAQIAESGLAGGPGRTVDLAIAATRAIDWVGAGSFDLRNDQLITSDILVNPARFAGLPRPFSDVNVRLQNRTVLLAGMWSAADPGATARRVSALMPTSGIGRLLDALSPLQAAVALIEPEFANLCIGHVDPEVVPGDRLVVDARAPSGSWRPRCRT
jgi:hypothetical protein